MDLLEEYKSQIVALIVSTVSIPFIYESLASYVHLKNYVIPRFIVLIAVLLAALFTLRYVKLLTTLKNHELPELTEDQEFILSMHKDLPIGNGQCAPTLIEGQGDIHLQEAQYHLDRLNDLGFIEIINHYELDSTEALYQLTEHGRRYLYENNILYKKWGA
jgi:hypothetical protein